LPARRAALYAKSPSRSAATDHPTGSAGAPDDNHDAGNGDVLFGVAGAGPARKSRPPGPAVLRYSIVTGYDTPPVTLTVLLVYQVPHAAPDHLSSTLELSNQTLTPSSADTTNWWPPLDGNRT